jgi:hypothetical protein
MEKQAFLKVAKMLQLEFLAFARQLLVASALASCKVFLSDEYANQ